jgi:nucleotide-binding universal stress UspA family protein
VAGLTPAGAHGRSVLAGTILGSVSQALLHHAAGPVVIVIVR